MKKIPVKDCVGPGRIFSQLKTDPPKVGCPKNAHALPKKSEIIFEWLATLPSVPLHYLRKNKLNGMALRYLCVKEVSVKRLYARFLKDHPEKKKTSGKSIVSEPTFRKVFQASSVTLTRPKNDHFKDV